MKVLKWIYANKVSLTGLIALILFIIDDIFNLRETLDISQETYYSLVSIFFIIIGLAIKGRGFESQQAYKEAIAKEKMLKEGKSTKEILTTLAEMIIDEEQVNPFDEEQSKNSTDNKG